VRRPLGIVVGSRAVHEVVSPWLEFIDHDRVCKSVEIGWNACTWSVFVSAIKSKEDLLRARYRCLVSHDSDTASSAFDRSPELHVRGDCRRFNDGWCLSPLWRGASQHVGVIYDRIEVVRERVVKNLLELS
jgi:hypothetical protein